MKRMEFISKVASILNGASQEDVRVVLEAVGLVLENEVIAQYDRVKLFDYLYISGYEKPGGKRRNLYSGEFVQIPRHLQPHAEFTKSFKKKYREMGSKLAMRNR